MTAAPEAGARPAPRRPDWHRAAELLARRQPITDVATAAGCSRSQLSRKLNHDPGFQNLIQEFRAMEMSPAERLTALRNSVYAAIEVEVGKRNVRVLLWLAERLNLLNPPTERTPREELRELLSGLSAAELEEFESLRDAPPDAPPDDRRPPALDQPQP